MPVSAATLQLLIDAGLKGDQLLAIVASIDADMGGKAEVARTSRQERNARYYAKHGWTRLPQKQWQSLTDQIYERDGYICFYCGDTDSIFCVDHVVPLSRGGTNFGDNLVVACIPCNSSKCDKLLSEWKGMHQ